MQKTEIPVGSDISAGRYACLDCGKEIRIGSASSLPPCSEAQNGGHSKNAYRTVAGQGDAVEDPQS